MKIQIEFNPAHVQSYRLIGYENRMLRREDFDNDTIDAGELGAGHEVTALYELVRADSSQSQQVSLRYQETQFKEDLSKNEIGYLKLRYKNPDDTTSNLIEKEIRSGASALQNTTGDFRFACAVAGFGMLLRNSEYKGSADYKMIQELARNALGSDANGYRAEFLRLVQKAELLSK